MNQGFNKDIEEELTVRDSLLSNFTIDAAMEVIAHSYPKIDGLQAIRQYLHANERETVTTHQPLYAPTGKFIQILCF